MHSPVDMSKPLSYMRTQERLTLNMGRRRKFSFTGISLRNETMPPNVTCTIDALLGHFTELQLAIAIRIEYAQLNRARPPCIGHIEENQRTMVSVYSMSFSSVTLVPWRFVSNALTNFFNSSASM